MRKIDINKLNNDHTNENAFTYKQEPKIRIFAFLKSLIIIILRVILSVLSVTAITATLILLSLRVYVLSLTDDNITLNLSNAKLALTSFIYVNDENGVPQEYQRIFNSENRIWVEFNDIPAQMIDAIIAIEDKRFYEHKGVDWVRTGGAVINLLKGSQSYGGSTLTQQLIKNITADNEVSLTRKLREIFRAIHLEQKYSKDEIIEAYLNIVNFGGGCRGIQTAANLYFNKNIQDCSIAECAAIAGITQNPTLYNPIYNPENNKKRRETVIWEMFDQGKISEEQYNQAIAQSQNMAVASNIKSGDNNNVTGTIRNWYVETLFRDVVNDLCTKYNIGKAAAEDMIFTHGLKIYAAMDSNAQSIVENSLKEASIMPKSPDIEIGYIMMGFDGRILATVGCREEKTGNLWYDRANVAKRQPGSTIKPIAVYAPAIDIGLYNYSSLIPDQPLKVDLDGSGELKNWPNNWYHGYKGNVTLQWALEKSANAPVAQVLNNLTTYKSYEFLTNKLGFNSLDASDASSLSALATGGTHVGVTVREMTAAFQIFGNGGNYYKPYSYFYVTDNNDNVILDNRSNLPTQAISSSTATIMNRLLRQVIIGPEGTGRGANINGWEIVGKTGTTTDDFDSWFIGASPYAVAGIWTGYDNPKRITETSCAIRIWKHIMTQYLNSKAKIDFSLDPDVVQYKYCKSTGNLASSSCPSTAIGYYASNNTPQNCYNHYSNSENNAEPATNEVSVETAVENTDMNTSNDTTNENTAENSIVEEQ